MVKLSKILFSIILVLIFSQTAAACINIPIFQAHSDGECSLSINALVNRMPESFSDYYQWDNSTAVENMKKACNLTDDDVSYIKEMNQKGDYLEKQTEAEYEMFLKNARKSRRNIFIERKFTSIERHGEWTAYKIISKKFFPFATRTRC